MANDPTLTKTETDSRRRERRAFDPGRPAIPIDWRMSVVI